MCSGRGAAIVPLVTVHQKRRRVWLYPALLLGSVAAVWFLLLLGLDLILQKGSMHISEMLALLLSRYNASEVQAVLGNLPEVVVAILGIAITVVSIIVQLSATRYTPRVTEMFFRDRTNFLALSFFVVTSIHCIWATFFVRQSFTPRLLVVSTLVMITLAILLLMPYFVYVFAFLDPERVVVRLQEQALAVAVDHRPGRSGGIGNAQRRVLEGIEQLADVAVNAISQKDRIIASRAVDALRDLVTSYLEAKAGLVPEWFGVGPDLRRNPDFVVMSNERVQQLASQRTWLEWKALRQYQTIYNESLNRMRDTNELVAIDTRYVGEAALRKGDDVVLGLAVKYFNTYLRSAINRADVRSTYNALHQYRQLAEALIRAQQGDRVLEVARYFSYYGQTANAAGLSFVTETAAHDLGQLCEVAHQEHFAAEQSLLQVFLDVDKAPETEAEELSLRGVRKAQVKLATYYLVQGCEPLARMIWEDMESERPERLQSIRNEMLAVKDPDFWEIIDRGDNFDYLDPARRSKLEYFYSWFGGGGSDEAPQA